MGCCPGKFPSASAMAKDMSMTALNAMRQALKSGEILAQQDVVLKRLAICNTPCEYKTGVRCLRCGCYITLKTAVLAATCPEGKW